MLRERVDPKKFETFAEINALINSTYGDAHGLLTLILESATRLTEGTASSLLLLNPQNNILYFEIALGSKAGDIKNYSLRLGEGIAGWVAKNSQSIIVNDVENDERFYAEISKALCFPTTSILAVPMRIQNLCIGVIEIINKAGGKPFVEEDREWLELFSNQAAIAIQNSKTYQSARDELSSLRERVDQGFHEFVGGGALIREKLELVRRIAPTDSSVLILGESGTGKELFAEQIHLAGRRAKGPFIRVNCAALSESLLESELFGHVKGAFTDAVGDRRGRFELADGGTLFLDEIAEISPGVQAKLLRVLQAGTFERLGSSQTIRVDVRIVAATNKDIEAAVESGAFRRDLYYRLNVLPLHIPPLRRRSEDIPALAEHFRERFNAETKKRIRGFAPAAMENLLRYSWPGNVRELENVVERAVVLAQSDLIGPADLQLPLGSGDDPYAETDFRTALNVFKKNYIHATLERCRWNQTAAAEKLGLQRTYLARLIKELDLKRR